METVRNQIVEVRRYGEGRESQAELAGLELAMSEEKKERDKVRRRDRYAGAVEKMVRWERFLSQRSLRVLLVEVDDCTRQVVSALLRNCSYQVTAVGDGLQAWELLEDPSNRFDIVVTEVVMPSLSGFGLLCKIMSHETLKNIPVIMMSSLDSIGIVFKCLSKGAVDFLVKPVRKNELQNLWQHVWRRCYSSSGSGSGSGSPIQNAAQTKSEAGSGNNIGSIGGSENNNSGLNVMEGSDNGSGIQGSRTNQDVEVESSQQRGKWEQCCSYGNTFAQVTQSKKEKTQNEWVQMAETSGKQHGKDCEEAMGEDLEIAVPRQVPTYVECLPEESTLHARACERKEAGFSASCEESDQLGAESVNTRGEPLTKATDLIGSIASKPQHGNMDQEDDENGKDNVHRGVNYSYGKVTALSNDNSPPELELTLKRPKADGDGNKKLENKCSLRQSDASAFSRYNTSGTHFSLPWGGSLAVNVHSLPKEYGGQACMSSENPGSLRFRFPFERVGSSKGSGGDATDHNQLSESTNNQDRGSSVAGPSGQDTVPSIKDQTILASPLSLQTGMPMPMAPGIISYDGVPPVYGAALHPLFYSYTGLPFWGSAIPHKAEKGGAHNNSVNHEPHIVSPQALCQSHHYDHLHHHHIQYHHHHHHHHHHKAHQHKHNAKQDEQTVDNAAATASRASSCNMPGNTLDGNYGEGGSSNGHESNGNVNGSASGSNNNGSNVQNGQSRVVVTAGSNGGSGNGNTITSGAGNGVKQNRFAQREAALTKFRQKRKERCFEKKVRYQSRKMLAEQRPRLRGQFVRQSINGSEARGVK